MTPAQLKAAITPRSQLLMLNSPVQSDRQRLQPGRTRSAGRRRARNQARRPQRRDLRAARLRQRQGDLLRHAAAGAGRAASSPSAACSKSYAMTGWRMGWASGRCRSSRRWATCRARRRAARRASASTRPWPRWRAIRRASSRCAANSRRGAIWSASALNALPGIRCPIPDGAFYAFFNVEALFRQDAGGQEDHRLAPASAPPPWKRSTSTSCRAPRSAPKATCGCRSPPAGSRSTRAWTCWRSFCRDSACERRSDSDRSTARRGSELGTDPGHDHGASLRSVSLQRRMEADHVHSCF